MRVKGISGNVANVYSADKVVLQFANFRQPIDGMTAFDLTRFSRGAGGGNYRHHGRAAPAPIPAPSRSITATDESSSNTNRDPLLLLRLRLLISLADGLQLLGVTLGVIGVEFH